MKTIEEKKELLKINYKNFMEKPDLNEYLSLLDDDRFEIFNSFVQDKMIKLKMEKDVLIYPEFSLTLDDENSSSELNGYIISIEFNLNDLLESYEIKYGEVDFTELWDEFFIYLETNVNNLDFEGFIEPIDNRQFISYRVKANDIDKNNFINNIHKSIMDKIKYDNLNLKNILKNLPNFGIN